MAEFQEKSDILSTDQLAEGIFRLTLNAPRIDVRGQRRARLTAER